MITKTQWGEVCSYVYSAKMMRLEPLFNGRRVLEVNLTKNEIVTIKRGEPNIRYKHPDSFNNYKTLDYLQSLVSFEKLNLKQLIKFSNNL
jgi:hypothetical protein